MIISLKPFHFAFVLILKNLTGHWTVWEVGTNQKRNSSERLRQMILIVCEPGISNQQMEIFLVLIKGLPL